MGSLAFGFVLQDSPGVLETKCVLGCAVCCRRRLTQCGGSRQAADSLDVRLPESCCSFQSDRWCSQARHRYPHGKVLMASPPVSVKKCFPASPTSDRKLTKDLSQKTGPWPCLLLLTQAGRRYEFPRPAVYQTSSRGKSLSVQPEIDKAA